MFNIRSVIPFSSHVYNQKPECFGWKDDMVTVQPKHIYLLNKHCLSCHWYRECIFASEKREKESKNGN